MGKTLRVLIVEDSENDALLMLRELKKGGYEPDFARVETAEGLRAALDRGPWEIILSDYKMAGFTGLEALAIIRERLGDIPFILISGTVGEDVAVGAMKRGANDYLLKGKLMRLVPAVERELAEFQMRRERQAAQEALRLAHFSISHASDPVFWVDGNGRFLYVNEAAIRVFEYSLPEFLTMTVHDLNPDFPPDRWEAHMKMLREKRTMTFEEHGRTQSGRVFPAEITVNYAEFEGKEYCFVFVRDITDRKRAEEQLNKSRTLLSATSRMAKVGGWEFDRSTKDLKWTEEVYRIHEVGPDYQPTVENAIDFYTPDSRPVIQRAVQRAIEHGEPFNLELEVITAKGNRKWVHAVGGLDRERDVIGGTFQDISERKRAEQILKEHRRQLLQIIDTVPHMIFAKDKEGRFLLVNRAIAEAYQKEPKDLIGTRWQDIHPDLQEAEQFLKGDLEVLASGKPMLIANEPFTDAQGRKHILQTVKIPFKMAGVNEDVILGVSVDVTEQRKVEEFRNDIIKTVSHELRTPLSIQKEGVNLVLDGTLGPLSPKQEMVLQTVMRSVNRLSRMIGELLDISRIESGKIELRKEKTVLADLLRDVVFEFRKKFEAKGLELKLKLPETAPEVLADPDKITQVLTNLVENAFKFTEKGGVEISLGVLKNEIECVVQDTGAGIPSENIEKIFDKFQQFGRTAGPGEKGLGLGLSIAKEIVGLHGGRIWAQSEPGKGTRITFTLPLCDASALKSAAKGAEPRQSSGGPLFRKRRVL